MKYLYSLLLVFAGFFLCYPAAWLQAQGVELQRAIFLDHQFPDSAYMQLRSTYNLAVKNKDQVTAGKCLQQMGKLCYNQGYYAKALEYYQLAETIFVATRQLAANAANANDIGLLYHRNTNKQAARLQYNKALQLYKQINDKAGIAETYGHIGFYYEKEQRYDSAFYFQQLALEQYQSIQQHDGIAGIYENLGSIHEDLLQFDSALFYFNTAFRIYDTAHNRVANIEVLNNIGDVFRKTGNYQHSLTYSQQALHQAQETNNPFQVAAACKDIAQTYHLLKKHDSAYYYMEWSRKCLLEIYSAQNNRQMSFLQVIYDTNRKNEEIRNLESSRKANLIVFTAIGVIVVLLIFLCLLIISRQRLKIGQAQTLSEKNAAINRVQKDQLELKSKQLATHTLNVIHHHQLLDELKNRLSEMIQDDKRDQKKQLRQLVLKINQAVSHEAQWKEFTGVFEQVHQVFFDKLNARYNDLTNNDIKLLALHKMNIDSKDMATVLGISPDSLRVARYRLRKKLNIPEGDTLGTFIQGF